MFSLFRVLLSLAVGLCPMPAANTYHGRASEIAQGDFRRVVGPRTGGSVIDTCAAGSWCSWSVAEPTVVYDGRAYRMWFEGSRTLVEGESPYLYNGNIGTATSADGITWELANGGQPVMTPGPSGAFDDYALSHPDVIFKDGRYLMWYGGVDGRQAPSSVRVERIGLASSPDGIHWTRENSGQPVVEIGPAGAHDSIQSTGAAVLFIDERYLMWYGAYDGIHTIMFAESDDGIVWRKNLNPVSGIDEKHVGVVGPSVWWDGREYVMFYTKVLDEQWRLFAATSTDGLHWTPARGDTPVLGLSDPVAFDSAGPGRNHSAHPSQIILTPGRVRIWYFGEDGARNHEMRIGLIEASLPIRRRRAVNR